MHAGHLLLDLLFESNALMWTFLLVKNSHNEVFTIGVYLFVVIYAVHVVFLAKVLKVFYLMGSKCDALIKTMQKRLKVTCSEVQERLEND
jgi:hypothetical protein